jgi:hypothetical protein
MSYSPVDESGRPVYSNGPDKKGGILGAAIGLGTKLMNLSPGAGWALSGAISVAGSILGSLFKQKTHVILSPEQKYFQEMVDFYKGYGDRTKKARSIASAITGKPVETWNGNKIGYDNIGDAIANVPYKPTNQYSGSVSKAAPVATEPIAQGGYSARVSRAGGTA